MGTLQHCNHDPVGVRLRGEQAMRLEMCVDDTFAFPPSLPVIGTGNLPQAAAGDAW